MTAKVNEKDPRVQRTRNLLQEAFIAIVSKKDFKSITVKDITEYAKVNRATFYAHFEDKYALQESILTNIFTEILSRRIRGDVVINELVLENMVLSVCEYMEKLSTTCKKGFISITPLMEEKVKSIMHDIIFNALKEKHPSGSQSGRILCYLSTMTVCSVYGAAYQWNQQGRLIPPETLTKELLPFIMAGLKAYLSL